MSPQPEARRGDSVQVSLRRLQQIEEQRIEAEEAEQRARKEAERRASEEAERRAREEAEQRAREKAEQQRRREEAQRSEEREERLRLEEIRQRARVEAELRLERARLAATVGERARSGRARQLSVAAALIVLVALFAFMAQGWRAAATRAHARELELIAITGRHEQKSSALHRSEDALNAARQREEELHRKIAALQGELADARLVSRRSRHRRPRPRVPAKSKPRTPVISTHCEDSDDPIDCIKMRGVDQ